MGQNLMSSGVESLNYQDLAAGIEDVLTKQQPKISYQEAQQVLNQFFQELEAKVAGAAKAEGEKFLAENAKREGVKVTASGLQYEILEPSLGQKPKATDTVRVHYEGTLIDGTVFLQLSPRRVDHLPVERCDCRLDGRIAVDVYRFEIQILHSVQSGIRRARCRSIHSAVRCADLHGGVIRDRVIVFVPEIYERNTGHIRDDRPTGYRRDTVITNIYILQNKNNYR